MTVSAEWVRGFVESFVSSYIDARFPKISEEIRFIRKGSDDMMAEKAALEDRVSELEARIPEPEIRTRPAQADTFDGRCVVPESRVLRWEAIERAARAHVGMLPAGAAQALRYALDEDRQ